MADQSVGRNMSSESHCHETAGRHGKSLTGKRREGHSYYSVAKNLDILWPEPDLWKVDLESSELGYLMEIKQNKQIKPPSEVYGALQGFS